jgi:hypothetical protein
LCVARDVYEFKSLLRECTKVSTTQIVWEDEENNRHVALTVEYDLSDAKVCVTGVTPTRVTFLCPSSQSPLRSIGVFTAKGREILARAFRGSAAAEQLLGDASESVLAAQVG